MTSASKQHFCAHDQNSGSTRSNFSHLFHSEQTNSNQAGRNCINCTVDRVENPPEQITLILTQGLKKYVTHVSALSLQNETSLEMVSAAVRTARPSSRVTHISPSNRVQLPGVSFRKPSWCTWGGSRGLRGQATLYLFHFPHVLSEVLTGAGAKAAFCSHPHLFVREHCKRHIFLTSLWVSPSCGSGPSWLTSASAPLVSSCGHIIDLQGQ